MGEAPGAAQEWGCSRREQDSPGHEGSSPWHPLAPGHQLEEGSSSQLPACPTGKTADVTSQAGNPDLPRPWE